MSDPIHRLSALSPDQRRNLAQRLANRALASRLHAYVVPAPGATPSAAELRRHLEERLPAHAIPSTFEIVDRLPRLPNGKIDRRALPCPNRPAEPSPPEPAAISPAEAALLAIWQELLGFDEISVHDDFFEIGGDSILSIQVISRARAAGLQISPQEFADHPTISALAALGGTQPKSAPRAASNGTATPPPADIEFKYLVPIQTEGSRPPLFCMHSGGDAALYRGLSRHLGPDVPVYGLQALGLAGNEALPATIEASAIPYLREVRAIQPSGPYYLLGSCFGAAVGLEMAHRLVAEGEEVGLLVVVDAAAPVYTKPEPPRIWEAVRERNPGRVWRRLKRNAKAAVTTSEAAVRARSLYVRHFGNPAQRARERFREIYRAFLRAFYVYRREPYHGPVLFCQGTDSPTWGRDLIEDWRQLAPGLEVESYDCTHREFLDEPHVQVLARNLSRRLPRSQEPAALSAHR